MTEIKHPLADCANCPLQNEPFVPSAGPNVAEYVIVGEAPGAQEAYAGIPFVGASGKLLNEVLAHHGIKREDCFVTNTVLCRPKNNENPPAQATRACRDRMVVEIRERRPKRILSLGNFATRAILGTDKGITQARIGPPKLSESFPGVEVVPTFHTAAALYNPGSFPDIVTDIGKLAGTHVIPSWDPPEYIVYEEPEDAIVLLNRWLSTNVDEIALDIEIGVDKDLDYEHADQYRLLAIGLCYEPTQAHVIGEKALESEAVTGLLGKLVESKRIICHNGKFDLQGLLRFGDGRLYFDTMLASYALDERGTGIHGLEYQSVERLGSPTWKDTISKYLGKGKNYAVIPRPVLYQYNAWDVANTFRLYEVFNALIPIGSELRRLHDHMVEVSNVMQYVERNGVELDLEYLTELEEYYDKRLDDFRWELRHMVGEPAYNPNSWQQVTRVLKDVYGRRVKNTRKETIEKVGEHAARNGKMDLHKFCQTHLQYKKDAKSYGTYVKGSRTRLHGSRLYPTFKLHGTVTGRSSCNNPNVQNITRGDVLRKLFIPGSDEHTFVQADYSQVEFRVIATLAQEPYLRDIFLDPRRNIHEEVGRNFYGHTFSKADKERYIRAKAVVFGLTYGREAYSLAVEFGVTEQAAQAQIDNFFELIPNVLEWRAQIQSDVLNLKDLVSPYGQHRRFHLITSKNRANILKECLAFLPQNIAAHTTFAAAVEMVKRAPEMRDMLRINVHDSWLAEAPIEDANEVGFFMAKVMEETAREKFTDYVPLPAELAYGSNWGEIT